MKRVDLTLAAFALATLSSELRGQCETQSLIASDGWPFAAFGHEMALEGDTLLVSAPGQGAVASVYVFENGPTGWLEVGKLLPSSGGDVYGCDLSGGRAVTSANGYVYVFEKPGGGWWTEVDSFTGSQGPLGRVVLDGDVLLASSYPDRAHVFEYQGGSWVESAVLDPGSVFTGNTFGSDLDLDGDVIVVGSIIAQSPVGQAGAAFVYERGPAGWAQTAFLYPPDGVINDNFGADVAVDGDLILIGSAGHGSGWLTEAGAVYAFQNSGGGWTQIDKLVSPAPEYQAAFGAAVDIDRGRALIGEALAEGLPPIDAGAVHRYRFGPQGWERLGRLEASEPQPGDGFGASVLVAEGWELVQAPSDAGVAEDSGRVSVFREREFATAHCFCDATVPCGNGANLTNVVEVQFAP